MRPRAALNGWRAKTGIRESGARLRHPPPALPPSRFARPQRVIAGDAPRQPHAKGRADAAGGALGIRVLSRPADRSTWPLFRLAGTRARTLAALANAASEHPRPPARRAYIFEASDRTRNSIGKCWLLWGRHLERRMSLCRAFIIGQPVIKLGVRADRSASTGRTEALRPSAAGC